MKTLDMRVVVQQNITTGAYSLRIEPMGLEIVGPKSGGPGARFKTRAEANEAAREVVACIQTAAAECGAVTTPVRHRVVIGEA